MDPMPGGPLAGLSSAISAALPPAQGGGGGHKGATGHLNPLQFGKILGGGGGEAAAGGEGLAELAPLALAA